MGTTISGATGIDKVQDGTIVNADINSSAAIAGSKLVMPTGSVLQVVYANHNTDTSVTSTSDISSGLTATITPSSSSSKILITANIPIRMNGDIAMDVNLYKGSSSIFLVGNDAGDNGNANHENMGPYSFCYLDSPSTTSATTYTVYVRSTGGSYTFNIFSNGQYGTMTLQEIAG